MNEPTPSTADVDTAQVIDPAQAIDPAEVTEELLVEEISIDGMCGVY